MKTCFPISRILVMPLGIWAGVILIGTLLEFIGGRPADGYVKNCGGFSWADSCPAVRLSLALAWECLAFGGTLLMWFRPRAGYFCAGMGYLLYMTTTFMEWIGSPDISRDLDASGWMLRLFALPVWFFWLCVKDEPPASFRLRDSVRHGEGRGDRC